MTAAPQEVTATLVDQLAESGRTVGAVGLALSRGLILVEKAMARFALHGVVPVISSPSEPDSRLTLPLPKGEDPHSTPSPNHDPWPYTLDSRKRRICART